MLRYYASAGPVGATVCGMSAAPPQSGGRLAVWSACARCLPRTIGVCKRGGRGLQPPGSERRLRRDGGAAVDAPPGGAGLPSRRARIFWIAPALDRTNNARQKRAFGASGGVTRTLWPAGTAWMRPERCGARTCARANARRRCPGFCAPRCPVSRGQPHLTPTWALFPLFVAVEHQPSHAARVRRARGRRARWHAARSRPRRWRWHQ